MGRAFGPLASPSAHVTLFWVRELKRIEISLQIKLNQDPDAVHTGLIEAVQTKIVHYSSFVTVKKSLSIFINLWEKKFCCSYLEFLDEFSNQLMVCQLRTIRGSETGQLDENLLRLLSECNIQIPCCRRTHQMEVRTRIEQVLFDLKLVNSLKKNKMVEFIHKGQTKTWTMNIVIPISSELDPTIKDWSTVPPLCDIWIYYRSQIKEIILEFGITHLPK